MAGTLGLYEAYGDRAEAEREMADLIHKFHDDTQAWQTKHAAGGGRDTAVREGIWRAVAERFGAFGSYALKPEPQAVKKPSSAIGDDPPPREPPQKSAAPGVLLFLWNLAGNYKFGKLVFALAFIVIATFYFKDRRLAEEAKKNEPPAQPLKTPEQPQPDPDQPPPGWDKMTDEELAKLGFRRVTREEFDKMILPGTVVVLKGLQGSSGFRVAYTEEEWAFLEDLADPRHYHAVPFDRLERKTVPTPMPQPAVEPAPEPRPADNGPVVRPKPKG